MEVQLALGTVDPLKLSNDDFNLYAALVRGGGYSPKYDIVEHSCTIPNFKVTL